jgi:hypothetical protein
MIIGAPEAIVKEVKEKNFVLKSALSTLLKS